MANEYYPTQRLYMQYNEDGETNYYAIKQADFDKFINAITTRLKPGDTNKYTMAQVVENMEEWLSSDVRSFLDGNLTQYQDANITNLRSYVFMGMPNLSYVSCPEVATIGASAFADCASLQSVYLPKTTSVAADAFAGITSLTQIEMGTQSTEAADIGTIGGAKLWNQTNLQKVSLQDTGGVVANAFASKVGNNYVGLSQLTEVNLPEAAGAIGNSAFQNCSTLTALNMPKAAGIVNRDAFAGCSALKELYLPEITAIGSTSGDTTYYAFGTGEYILSNLTLGVKTMSNWLRGIKNSLEKITLLSCTKVNNNAFKDCSKLITANIPELTTIGTNAFDGTAIESINFPKTTGDIGANAFQNCFNLTEIKPKDLGSAATFTNAGIFSNCSNLTKVHLSTSSFTGTNVFSNCSLLKDLTVDNLTTIKTDRLFGVNNSTAIPYPFQWLSFKDLTTITSVSAFAYCSNLEGGNFPKLTTIADNTFAYCSNLTRVGDIKELEYTEPSVDDEGNEALTINNKSVGLSLPLLTTMGKNAFLGCSALEEINLPALTTSVPINAFNDCSNLTTVVLGSTKEDDSPTMKTTTTASLGAIFPSANETLTNITIHTSYINDTFTGKTGLKSVILPETISIGDSAFKECVSLNKINIVPTESDECYLYLPKITTIGANAFEGCVGLTAIDLPINNGNITLKNYAFKDCNALITANLGSVSTLPTGVFQGCAELCNVSAPNITAINYKAFNTFDSNNKYVEGLGMNEGATPFKIYAPKVTAVNTSAFYGVGITKVLSSYSSNINGLYLISSGLTAIGNDAFRGCSKLTEVYLPNNPTAATTIGTNAFNGCSALTIISAPATDTLNIGIFTNCSALEEVYFGQTTKIPAQRFNTVASTTTYKKDASAYTTALASALSNLKKVIFPKATTLETNAFFGCVGLTTVSMPALLTIASKVFNFYYSDQDTETVAHCCPLTSMYAPGLKTISKNAFQGTSFTKITSTYIEGEKTLYVPSLETIGANAFEDCRDLTEIHFPNTMTTIGSNAFENCSLNIIYVARNVTGNYPTIGENTFAGHTDNLKIYGENGFIGQLLETSGWAQYSNYIQNKPN